MRLRWLWLAAALMLGADLAIFAWFYTAFSDLLSAMERLIEQF